MASGVVESRAEGGGAAAGPSAIVAAAALLLILLVGLGLRTYGMKRPLQLNEYPAVYAVAERRVTSEDLTPGPDVPLLPVESADAVRERSVMPFGVRNPTPVYHYLLHAVVQSFGISEWSLRLLSLLAGAGCIV